MAVTIIFIFLAFTALFAGAEIAFISASKLRVELKKEKGSRKGEILARFYEKPEDFIGAMLVGLNITLVVITALMTELLTPYYSQFIKEEFLLFLAITLTITLFILLIGEFLPKIIFQLYSDNILFFLAYPLQLLLWILRPITWIMTNAAKGLLGFFFKVPSEQEEVSFTKLDLENFIRSTRTADSEEDINTVLFEKALYLPGVKVKGCMVPRREIVQIDISQSVEELLELFKETRLSKILVTQNEDIDEVIGYVHHQQLLKKPKDIKAITMDIPIVPEMMRVDSLLNLMIKQQVSIATVVDEFGSTAGVITMEDILEQVFGDIDDEHDQEEYTEIRISEYEFLLSGRLEVDYLNDKYAPVLDFPKGDYSTLSGYIIMTIGKIPEQGGTIELDGYNFILEVVSPTKIETLRVVKTVIDG